MNEKTAVLVDGSYYLFRAYYALPPLQNEIGEPTGAIFGVIGMLDKLRKEYDPAWFAVVFDAKGESFRNRLYPPYKKNRPPIAEDLKRQIAPLHDIIRAMGLPLLSDEEFEADDIIATLAVRAQKAGMWTIVASGDKDLAQLVGPRVRLADTMSETVLDAAGVERKYSVPPERIVDLLTLTGDTVDNVPGIPKVGPKTAVRWLREYGDLDGVVAHAEDIRGKIGENLRAELERIPLFRELVTLRRDVPGLPEALSVTAPDTARLREHYRRWGFRKRLEEMEKAERTATVTGGEGKDCGSARNAGMPPAAYACVTNWPELERWLERLRGARVMALDTETTSLDVMSAELVGLSFAVEEREAAYVPFAHDYEGAPAQLPRAEALERLRPILEDPERLKLGHNLKFDLNVLARHGIRLAGIAYDSMLESYVLDSTASPRHDLDSLARKYLDHETTRYEDVAGKGAKQVRFNQVSLERAAPYAAEDADACLRLHRRLWPALQKQRRACTVFADIEMPLVEVLAGMETDGVRVDVERLERQSRDLTEQIAELERRAHDYVGHSFNLNSTAQVRTVLFEQLGLPVLSRTPKGEPSTSESVLQELAIGNELAALLREHRALNKLKTTYTDKLPRLIHPRTGRIHTFYHQATAVTGRLASQNPNLQNIPIRTPEGRRVRRAFVAEPSRLLLTADYSQIELRIMAHLSNDERLLAAFAADEDVHACTAAEVFDVPLEQVTREQRGAAKEINFGLLYGMSPFGLARQLGIARKEASDYVERYFERYAGVRDYMEGIRAQARQQGYVETWFGRRLYLPDLKSKVYARRQAAERAAINAPMQGTAADIIKRAMIDAAARIERLDNRIRMIMQVHDELVFELPEDRVQEWGAEVRACMEGAAELRVPLRVQLGHGENWEEAH